MLKFDDSKFLLLQPKRLFKSCAHKLVNLLKVKRRCGTPRLTTMISIDGRLREKSNAKVATNESRDANAEGNELSIEKDREQS